jgi:hypothetical protein
MQGYVRLDWSAMSVRLWKPGSYRSCSDTEGKPDPYATLTKVVRDTADNTRTLTGGEHRKREQPWVVPYCTDVLNALISPFSVGKENGTKRYRDFFGRLGLVILLFPLVLWNAARGKIPALPWAEWTAEDYITFNEVQSATGSKAIYMRGIPSPRALTLFSGVFLLGLLVPGFLRRFEKRVGGELEKILAKDPKIVIQFELPAELAMTSTPIPGVKRLIAWLMMRMFTRLIKRSTPKGTRIAFHLCWGDLDGHPFVPLWLQSNRSKVVLMRAIRSMRVWRSGWELFEIHDPHCDGKNPPKMDEASYRAYNKLWSLFRRRQSDFTYALGILHVGRSTEEIVNIGKILISKAWEAGIRDFDIATPCGEARKSQEEVDALNRQGLEVIPLLEAYIEDLLAQDA